MCHANSQSKNYLKENDLINKDGTVTLYRYLNIAESNKLQPDKGLSSTTLNPAHAKKMAINVTKHSKDENVLGISCTGLASNYDNKSLLKVSVGTVFFAVYFISSNSFE